MASADDHEGAVPTLVGPEGRAADGFGGIVPSASWVRGGESVLMALAVEHYADGAAVPLLVLTDAPGIIGFDPEAAITATDDAGRTYETRTASVDAGLGAAQATVWLTPALPASARTLTLSVSELTRTTPTRRGGGVAKPLTGGPWSLEVPLLPDRTATEPPERPRGKAPTAEAPRAPTRAAGAFERLVPVGQARMSENAAVCVWGIEDYGERAVLTLGVLTTGLADVEPLAPGRGEVQVWDEAGTRYAVVPINGAGEERWIETSLEVTPAPREARALGLRITNLPGRARRAHDRSLEGPFTFGIALPDPA